MLPSPRNAETIAMGEGVAIPVRLCFDDLPEIRRPVSATAPFSTAWQADRESDDLLEQVVHRWRYQRR